MRPPPAPVWPRLLLLLPGLAALAGGLAGGLVRIGWPWLLPVPAAVAWHGPLMLSGLFVVVIGLERAVAVGHRWAFAAPLAAGAGTGLLLAGLPVAGFAGYALGSAVLLLATLAAARRQPEAFLGVLVLGAAAGLLGNVQLALGAPVPQALLPLLGFLVLTVAGERLELSRYVPRPRVAAPLFVLVLALLLAALVLPPPWGARLFGAGLLALAGWLLAWDLARRSVRQPGLTRFVAVALLAGYGQLLVAGALLLGFGLRPGHASHDAALHALGLGFVFSMVLGHAPLIAPALLRIRPVFSPLLYAPLALLHASLLLRDAALLLGAADWRRAAGLGSALALAGFLGLMLALGLRARRP